MFDIFVEKKFPRSRKESADENSVRIRSAFIAAKYKWQHQVSSVASIHRGERATELPRRLQPLNICGSPERGRKLSGEEMEERWDWRRWLFRVESKASWLKLKIGRKLMKARSRRCQIFAWQPTRQESPWSLWNPRRSFPYTLVNHPSTTSRRRWVG